jgi:hypothetical protein
VKRFAGHADCKDKAATCMKVLLGLLEVRQCVVGRYAFAAAHAGAVQAGTLSVAYVVSVAYVETTKDAAQHTVGGDVAEPQHCQRCVDGAVKVWSAFF